MALQFGTPVLVSPADGAESLNRYVIMDWNAVFEADRYKVEWADNSNFYNSSYQIIYSPNSEKSKSFNWEDHIYWRVRAMKGDVASDWSEVRDFSIKPNPIEIIHPNPYQVIENPAEITVSYYEGSHTLEIWRGQDPSGEKIYSGFGSSGQYIHEVSLSDSTYCAQAKTNGTPVIYSEWIIFAVWVS